MAERQDCSSTALPWEQAARDESPDGLCYHRRQRVTVDMYADAGATTRKCIDCGAWITAGYQAPLPELVPMPFPKVAEDE